MTDKSDTRWKQRFQNYNKALDQLTRFVKKSPLNEFEEQGIIKAFEYTYELAWNVMKDYLEFQGEQNIYGSRDSIQEAFRLGLLSNGDNWMIMFKDRNKTSHTYNQETAKEVIKNIIHDHFPLFNSFRDKMQSLLGE